MIDNNKLNEMAEDYLQILNRVTAVIPKTLTVKRSDEVDAKTETLELAATDYKDIATALYIQVNRDKEKLRPASPKQIQWIDDLIHKDPDARTPIANKFLDDLKKKNALELTSEEASDLITILNK